MHGTPSLLWQLGNAREPVIAFVWERLPPPDLVRLRRTSRACAAEAEEAARRMRCEWKRDWGAWAPAWVGTATHRLALAAVEAADNVGANCCSCLCDWFGCWDGLGWNTYMRGELLESVGRLERHETARCLLRRVDPDEFPQNSALVANPRPVAAVVLDAMSGVGRGRGFHSFGCLARMLGWSLLGVGMQYALSHALYHDDYGRTPHDATSLLRGLRPTRDETRRAAKMAMDDGDQWLADVLDEYGEDAYGADESGSDHEDDMDDVLKAVVEAGGDSALAKRVVQCLARIRVR